MKRKFSVFDYMITITRKHRYLVVGSPEFGFQIAPGCLPLDKASPVEIGTAVLGVLERIDASLHRIDRAGEIPPEPCFKRGGFPWARGASVPIRAAADILGVSPQTLRRVVKSGALAADRTPGGHLRFRWEALSEYLLKHSRADQPESGDDLPTFESTIGARYGLGLNSPSVTGKSGDSI